MRRLPFWLLCLGLLSAPVAGCADPPEGAELAALKAQGQTVIDQIEGYKTRHGRYPGDLAAAGITLPQAKYGGWKYEVWSDGSSYTLTIGKYSEHSWTLGWNGSFWGLDS